MMRFGRNSGARKVRYRKRKAQKCHLRFCGTVNKRRALLPKRGALQVVKTKTCLWYFCGQTRNRRGFYHGDFHFWWTRRGSNPRPLRCERSALPAELRAHILFNSKHYNTVFQKNPVLFFIFRNFLCAKRADRFGPTLSSQIIRLFCRSRYRNAVDRAAGWSNRPYSRNRRGHARKITHRRRLLC